MPTRTSRELIGEHIEAQMAKDFYEDEPEFIDDYNKSVETLMAIESAIERKTNNIDSFMVDLSRREHLVDAEIEAFNEEITRLKSRKSALVKSKDFFNKYLLPIIIKEVGNSKGVYETSTARYKLFQTWGPLEVTDASEIDDQYFITKVVETIDKRKARADSIAAKEENKELPSGFQINKVDRIRRS